PGAAAQLDLRPKAIARWLNALPLADFQQSAAHLTALLQATNAAQLSPPARFRLVEQLREPALALCDGLRQEVTRRGLPLTRRARPPGDQIRGVLGALADGYKSVVVDLLSAPGKTDPDLLAHGLQRAFSALRRALHFDYAVYAPPTAGYWIELHRL